jgi:CelD/BcsL family acetyltransferase involved in cellulose biosynthesis
MSAPAQIRVLQNETQLDALREEWNDLLADSPADCLFLTWEWMTSWWRHLKGERELHVIEIRDHERLVGLAPFAVSHGRVEFMGTGTVGSDYLDVIARRGCEREVVEAVAQSLEATRLNLHFSHFLSGAVIPRLGERMRVSGYRIFNRTINVCPFMVLRDHTWDSFLSTTGKRHRENVRRRIRKLPGNASFHLTETREELHRNLRILIELHHRSWNARGGSDALQEGAVENFHKEFTEHALRQGWLRLFVLSIAGRPEAAVYAFNRKGRLLYYQAGVSPDRSSMSLGLVALALAIQHALDEGAVECDLLHGDEDYKSLWANHTRQLHVLDGYPRSFRGSLTMHSQRVLRAARTMARYVITR